MVSDDRQPIVEDPPGDPAQLLVELLDEGNEEAAVVHARSLHPAELADALAGADIEVFELVLRRFTPLELAPVVPFLEPHYRETLYEALSTEGLGELIAAIPDDLAADLLQSLEADVAEAVVAGMSFRDRAPLRALAAYDPTTAAGRMSGQSFSLAPDQTVADAVEALRRQRPETRVPLYAFVVDQAGRLMGVTSFAALLFADAGTLLSDLMRPAFVVQADADQEEAARLLKRYNLLALPVVDAEGHLLGVLTFDDVIDVLEEEATEDMLRLAGVNEDEALESVVDSVRFRLPWLSMNLVALMLAAYIISFFEATIAQVAIIAVFLPIVLGQGGNGGLQTVTVVVRSLALGRIAVRNTLRVARNELLVALVTGGAVGAAVGVLAWGWQHNAVLGLVVGAAVLINQLVGALAGVLFPMALHRLRQDPAVSAPIWLTNATDVLGALVLLGLATLVIGHLA